MHIILLNYYYSANHGEADALLERYGTLTGWAAGVAAAGAKVTVLQRFHHDAMIQRGSTAYEFIGDRHSPQLRKWQIPGRLHRRARALCAHSLSQGALTTAHVNGLLFPLQARALRLVLPHQCAIVAQHHAEKPWPGWYGLLQRWGLRAIDGYLFAGRALAEPFVQQGSIRSLQDVFPVMEGSCEFSPQDRQSSRDQTGLHGDPVVLWVGRLNDNKDPLTVLAAFERVLEQAAGARLYMAYGTEDLLPDVRERIARSAMLSRSVELLGTIPHIELERVYNSADYFVLGSHCEGSGYALAEALACGLVPVVTDIPSFRMMTDGGTIGMLWPPGDAGALSDALLTVFRRPWLECSKAARDFFEENLSYPAIGRRAVEVYQGLARRRAR
jgi:glycosyltransferase involved in cell wall biosynthesis